MKTLEKGIIHMRSKKSILIIIILITSIILSSCVGSRELNEIGIVMSTGIDYRDGKIIVTNEVMTPSASTSDNTEKNEVMYVQSVGDTIFEALRNTTLTFDRRLFLSHNRVIIFGEEFAKRGIGDYINFYLYDAEPRESAYMLVSKGAMAYEVMGINAGLSDSPGRYLESLVENYEHTSKTSSITFNEYFRYFFERGTPVLGIVQIVEKEEINKEKENKNKLALNVAGGAVFNEDTLVGYYSDDEMIGFNFIVNEIDGGLIIFETPDQETNLKRIATKGKYTTLEIKNSKTKNKIEIINGEINLYINVTLKGVIGEETKGLELTELNVVDAIEKACSNQVKKYISMTMDKAQKEFKLDTFGIDALFHREYPEIWRDISNNWRGVFPSINYNVNVETNILRTGLIDIPSNIKKGEKNAH
jgi:spore germination protein KC